MKLNQFAHYTPNLTIQQQELMNIGLINIDFQKQSFTDNLAFVINQLFPSDYSATAKLEHQQRILSSDDIDLATFLQQHPCEMPANYFNNMALQLLGFVVDDDYQLNDAANFMQKISLPAIKHTLHDNDDLVSAFYTFLNMRTPRNLIFLDDLANHGFFNDMLDNDHPCFIFFNGKSQPVFDKSKFIQEVVYVESPLDTDHDGKRDLLATTIMRPVETEKALKVPALYTADPYFCGVNEQATDQATHNVNYRLQVKDTKPVKDPHYQYQAANLPAARVPAGEQKYSDLNSIAGSDNRVYTLNEYLNARGFASVYAGGIGTRYSDGIRTTGGVDEIISTIAIIQWLHGDRKAYTNKTDNIEIKAWWCTGNVAMTGRSYLGTLATAAATTGVAGLKTIISEAAISSWYDYYRENGLVVAPEACQGEDTDVLAVFTGSTRQDAGKWREVKAAFDNELDNLSAGQDREHGNYNTFWDKRNYRNHADNIKCDVVYVHGLNDWNVKPRNVEKMWQKLQNLPINRKLILHEGQHIYINNMQSIDFNDMMNLWLSYELLGVDNNAPQVIPNVLIQDNVTPETWHTYQDWQSDYYHTYYPQTDEHLTITAQDGKASFVDNGVATFLKNCNDDLKWQYELLKDNSVYKANRLIWKTTPFRHDAYLCGVPKVTCRVKVNQNTGLLSAQLVDYGEAKRFGISPSLIAKNAIQLSVYGATDNLMEFQLTTATPFKQIAKGHINLQNQHNNWQNDPVIPNQWVDVTFELQPTHYHLLTDHQLGLVIYATDMAMTCRGKNEDQYTIDLAHTKIDIPFLDKQ